MGVAADRVCASPDVVNQADSWKQLATAPAVLPAVRPSSTRSPPPAPVGVAGFRHHRAAVGEASTAFHAGARALADRLGLGGGGVRGQRAVPVGIDVEATAATRNSPRHRFVAHGRWFTTKHRCRWQSVAVVGAGSRRRGGAGALIKDAKEQLRALPHPLSYGALRYLNPDVELAGSDPPIGFNYLGAWAWRPRHPMSRGGCPRRRVAGCGRGDPHAASPHRRAERRIVDTDSGAQLYADWMWAPSSFDRAAVDRLSRLWLQALAGICAHVRAGAAG
ncbi:linear gramicidin synthetase subunit D domain protein [Mycobacterium xenopi 4042]|uniref:Linear gramicidin synthetase subunit D domain protein n=1 Tax=Mycobacterium xenopi 4042 TaxID=1299334 RepID=X8AGR3_MYCXE|nr:linear gramicidin synthetase subunit D domain protein [Mycobacterium xenopi 4042]